MNTFQSLFRDLKAGCLEGGKMVKMEAEGAWCILCCNLYFPERSKDRRGRVTGRKNVDGAGPTLLNEFCHQLRITDERFLESLSSSNSSSYGSGKWSVCPNCFPFMERAVNRRRQCLVMEDRVNRLQIRVLGELRRLKEGMGRFYMDMEGIEGLVRVAGHKHSENDTQTAKNGPIEEIESFRIRILEVVKELQVYQTEIGAKLLSTSIIEERSTVKEEPHSDLEASHGHGESDMDWTLGGMDDVGNGVYDSDNANATKSNPIRTSSVPSLQPPPGKRKRISKPVEESDMEWNLDDDDEGDLDSDDGSSSDFEYQPAPKPQRPAKAKSTPKLRKKKASLKGVKHEQEPEINDEDLSSTITPTDCEKASPIPPRKKKVVNKPNPQQPPGLTKEDRFRINYDLDLAGLSYLRKYFILRSRQDQDKPKKTSASLQVTEDEASQQDLLIRKYTLEYDSTTETVTFNGVGVILNELDNLIQCSSCSYSVTWSEIHSKLQIHNSDHVIASRMEQRMADHILGTHLGAFNCPLCALQMTAWNKYFRHVKYTHLSFKDCNICGKPNLNYSGMKIHKWTHLNQEEKKVHCHPRGRNSDKSKDSYETFACDVCGKRLKTKTYLRQHQKTHLPEGLNRVVCPTCGRSMSLAQYNNYHMKYGCVESESVKESRKRDPQNPLGIKCVHCPSVLKNMYCLKQHVNLQHSTKGGEGTQCPICGKSFKHGNNLKRHMRSHENERVWKCGWGCGEEFNDKRGCAQHEAKECGMKPERKPEEAVRGEKEPHPCLHCSAILKNRQLFRQHMKRYHSEEADSRAHACGVCEKRFRMRGDLTDHLKTHREEKPWKCGRGCGKEFKVKMNWQRHESICKGKLKQ